MRQAVHAIADALAAMGIRDVTPAAPPAIRAA
jgi:hypothetical protein